MLTPPILYVAQDSYIPTILCLNGTLSYVDFMCVIMGDTGIRKSVSVGGLYFSAIVLKSEWPEITASVGRCRYLVSTYLGSWQSVHGRP